MPQSFAANQYRYAKRSQIVRRQLGRFAGFDRTPGEAQEDLPSMLLQHRRLASGIFVWYGKTSERQVEVAGLTPAGDTLAYVVGHLTWVPSETGASYGDLDPEYLTASYRVYLNEPDAKRVFAYIKKLQANSPVWNAEISNCTSFIGSIASFMGLKVPYRWQRPEEYVKGLKAMNGGRQIVHLSSVQ